MKRNGQLISEERKYLVINVQQAKSIVKDWLSDIQLANVTKLGLPVFVSVSQNTSHRVHKLCHYRNILILNCDNCYRDHGEQMNLIVHY